MARSAKRRETSQENPTALPAIAYSAGMRTTRRAALLGLLTAIALGACAEERVQRPKTLLATATLPGPAHEAVEVVVYDIPSGTVLDRVWLKGPEGERVQGAPVGRSTSETGSGAVAGPSIGIGVTGGSSSGINPSIGIGYGVSGIGGPSRQSRQVTYIIPLPPDLTYVEDPRGWHIDVHYLDVTGAPQVRTIAAPLPG